MYLNLTKEKIKFYGYSRIIGFYLTRTRTEKDHLLKGFSLILFSRVILNIVWSKDDYWRNESTNNILNFSFDKYNKILFIRKLAIGF